MSFAVEVRAILQHQPSEQVEEFLSACEGCLPFESAQDFSYRTSSDPVMVRIKGDIKALKNLRDKHPTALPRELLDSRIEEFELFLGVNDALNTGGKPTTLTAADLATLENLRKFFAKFFPALSSDYGRGNILLQLGEALIEKPIPRSIESMLHKDKEVSKNI